jgi:hypothetical protein
MENVAISAGDKLRAWLTGKPADWAQVIALRAALRALPYIANSSEFWLKNFALLPFGAVMTSWAQLTDRSIDVLKTGSRANARFAGISFDFGGYKNERVANMAAEASYHSADAQTGSMHVVSDCVKGVLSAAETFRFASARHGVLGEIGDLAAQTIWDCVENECQYLIDFSGENPAKSLAAQPFWDHPSEGWDDDLLPQLAQQLMSIDPNYSVWTDWYDRRIQGERAAFDIPGDKGRVEDKKVLRRVAEATDEDFWGKGHEYVNATLKSWLEEARARVAPTPPETEIETPPQEAGAIAYGINEQGKLDRLPHSNQVHLRDVPDQRRSYGDLRTLALELLEEGQRLGPRLRPKLDRFLQSLPEGFDDAEAYLVWRDGNALRRLFRAHREVANGLEPDPARLEAAVAEGLGGLLDLYNNFAFADDGLRAKDEARIPPQERANAAAEAVAAKPLFEAIVATPDIATAEALDDIAAEAKDAGLSADDPYAGQVLDQGNRTKRNIVAGLLSDTWAAFKNTGVLGQAIAGGAAWDGIKLTVTIVGGIDYALPLEFIATNAPLLQDYAAAAFSSYPNLPQLIENIAAFWNRYKKL